MEKEKAPRAIGGDSDRIPVSTQIPGSLVQRTLLEICQSTPFRASRQSRDLLQYIVNQSFAGHSELLKERLIGINVFGRRPDYDTNIDPIVRARAAEVRKRLAQFYQSDPSDSVIRIEIYPGSYLASFNELPKSLLPEIRTSVPSIGLPRGEQAPGTAQEKKQGPVGPAHKRRQSRLVILALAVVCVAVVIWVHVRPTAPIDEFWGPVVNRKGPVLIYSGANAVYMLSSSFMNRYEATHRLDALQSQGREFVVPMSSDTKLEPGDLVGFKNDFVTLGDLSANVRVASLLAMHKSRFDLRLGEDIAFSDLRQSPSVLVGAFNNSWTLELTGDLPFVFDRNLTIREQSDKKRTWTPVYAGEGKVAVDYAVVTRMPRSKTGEPLIAIAGITQSGTRAAAEYITDPEQIKALASAAPKDWSQKNVQFVLQTKIVNDVPTFPVLVALKSW